MRVIAAHLVGLIGLTLVARAGDVAGVGQTKASPDAATAYTTEIPGPLSSFARMAAVSQDVTADGVLSAVARNLVTSGYQAAGNKDMLEQTEYLKLLIRYLSQARELEVLAGPSRVIRIETCESDAAGELLRVLGYRMRGGCGSEVVLETVNASRAFITIDSGFPLAQLEEDLRTNRPFSYDFKPTQAALLYGTNYWLPPKMQQRSFIDALLADPQMGRLYLGMSKLDPVTADELRRTVSMQRLKAFAHVLDFFGSMFEIREGKAVVPGGQPAARAWEELVGVAPEQGAAFLERLLTRDDGWMASYFDTLARIDGPIRDYLTEPKRMKRFYTALRGRITSPGPARPVFRSSTDLILLTQRMRIEPDGRPHIPGGVEVWKELFVKHPRGKYDSKLTRLAGNWSEPDDVVEALFALCRKATDNEPLKVFMAISDINRHRTRPLEPATVSRLIIEYPENGFQYSIFADAPSLTDKTILQYLDTIGIINRIGDNVLRANTAGSAQALIALWQIFVRQGSISLSSADETLSGILGQFSNVRRPVDVLDAGISGVRLLFKAAGIKDGASPQDSMMDLLAGATKSVGSEAYSRVVGEMTRYFDSQRLVPLDTLLDMASHLDGLTKGERPDNTLLTRFAARTSEIGSPRALLTQAEKSSYSIGYWVDKHIEAQRKVNLHASIERAAGDAGKLNDLRGLLTPFLRDTLVGFVYIRCAPPAAQLILTNPLFVRSHDFLGAHGIRQTWKSTDLFSSGWPSNAGGKLVGSLAGLPYALAEAEQDFMIPEREQALIWTDLVPQMILSAKIPRWWNVSPEQMHWVGLHMSFAKSLIEESAKDAGRREKTVAILRKLAVPARVRLFATLLERGDIRQAAENVTPAEIFVLAKETLAAEKDSPHPLAVEIRRLANASPASINYEFVSRAFGTPKPVLTNSYQPELLYLRTLPTLMGYSSRIMAESWESNTLYWAALADEIHLPPAQLNLLIPEWTKQMVERIFATHLEDWQAVLRSLRATGEAVRLNARRQTASSGQAAGE